MMNIIQNFTLMGLKVLKIKAKWVGTGKKTRLINLENKKTIIKINPKFFRPAEVNILHGDSRKAQRDMNWKPKVNLKMLVKMMLEDEIKFYNSK